MEGNVYPCTWKKTKDGYQLSLKRKPSITAKGATFEAAREALWEEVMDQLGDGESSFEFDNPAPQSSLPKEFLTPELVILGGSGCAYARQDSKMQQIELQDGLFTSGYCTSCKCPLGQRTDTPSSIFNLWPDDAQVNMVGGQNPLFSDAFLALLSPSELKNCKFLEIDRGARGRKRFFELVGESVAPFVESRLLDQLPKEPWCSEIKKCRKCGWRPSNYYFPDVGLVHVVARNDLPRRIPACFVVGTSPDLSLCVTGNRWRSLLGKRGTRGITSSTLAIIGDPSDVVRVDSQRKESRTKRVTE